MAESDVMHTLKSNDDQFFQISRTAIQQSATMTSSMIFDETQSSVIPLEDIAGTELQRIVLWCEHHKNEPIPTPEESIPRLVVVPEWDKTFLDIDDMDLFRLIVAANFLDIRRLLNYGCRIVSDMAKDKTPEELRARFGIRTDEEDRALAAAKALQK